MPTIAHGSPTGRLMSAAVKAATDAVRGFEAEKMAWMYDCVQSMPMTTDEKFARMWLISPCSRLNAPFGSAAATAGSANSECAAMTPAMAIVLQMTIILRMPPTPALFMPPKKA